jgi:hypothetical protein
MNTKTTVSGLAMLAVAATPFAASAQSLAELIAKNPSLAAILAPYMAQSTSTASCAGTITKTLTKGMTDAEVMTLQKMLNASADTTVATTGAGSKGMEGSYFGAATKAAVIKFQNKYASEVLTPNGLTVGTGMVGAATRAKLNALCATAPTTSTNTGNTTTTTTSGELKGGAADLTSIASTEDVDDKELYTGQTEKVAAFKLQSNGGDAKVTNISVKFTKTAGTGSSYFANYFSGAEVYAAGQKIASVSASDLTRESSGVYSITIPVSQIVKQGSTNKVLFNVALTAKETVDSDDINTGVWTAEATSARFIDSTGVVLSKTLSVSEASIKVKRVSSSSDVYTSLAAGSNNPTDGKTLEVEDDKTTTVTLGAFSVKATGVKMKYDTVKAKITTTGVSTTSKMFDTIYLYSGDTQLDSIEGVSVATGTEFAFSLDDDQYIEKDATANFTIKAKVKAIASTTGDTVNFDQGDSVKLEVVKATAVAAKSVSDDKSIETTKGSYDARTAYFRSEGIYYTMSNPTAKTTSVEGDNNDYAEYTMDLKVTNFSDDEVTLALTSGTTTGAFKFANVVGANITSSVSRVTGGTETSGNVKIGAGSEATFKLSVTVKGTTGYKRVSLTDVTYNNGTTDIAVTAAPAEDFRTSEVNIVN